MAYTTLLTTTLNLLHCAKVGGRLVAFRATVPCGDGSLWQIPVFCIAGALLLPVGAVFVVKMRPVGGICTPIAQFTLGKQQ
jgi:hypothetical protein